MKILLIRMTASEHDCKNQTYNTQGIGLATELINLGNEVGLVYYAKPGNQREEIIETEKGTINVFHIEGKKIMGSALYNKWLYDLSEQYDILQTSEADVLGSFLLWKRFPNKTIIYHGPYESLYTPKHNIYSRIFYSIFSSLNGYKDKACIIAKSYMAEKTLRKFGFKHIITLGVGLNPHVLVEGAGENTQKKFDFIEKKIDTKYLLFIGTICKRKNLDLALKVLKEINNKSSFNYKLIVIGKIIEQDYYKKCVNFIKANELEKDVLFCGTMEQKYLKNVYKCCDAFLLPTRYDIFGMVYLESMYFELPIITTLCGGSSMLIKNRESGYICDIDDITSWTNSLLDLENCNRRDLIKNNAKKTIMNNFLWCNLAPRFYDYYRIINDRDNE